MHLLILIAIVMAISFLHLPPLTLSIVYGVIAIIWIPDAILAIRKSPPFVPTFKKDKEAMLRLAQIKKNDMVIDPGCGDGRLVFAAAALGAYGIGYEYSFPAFVWARVRAIFHPGSTIYFGDLWKQNYTDADVVFCYLLTETMQDFKKIIWPQLKPGCRVVSNSFRMKDLKPDGSDRGMYLYVK